MLDYMTVRVPTCPAQLPFNKKSVGHPRTTRRRVATTTKLRNRITSITLEKRDSGHHLLNYEESTPSLNERDIVGAIPTIWLLVSRDPFYAVPRSFGSCVVLLNFVIARGPTSPVETARY